MWGGQNIKHDIRSHNFPHSPLFETWNGVKILNFKILPICFHLACVHFFSMTQVSTNIAFKFCHTHIIMWFFIPSADRKFISHKLHSYFSPVSASTGSTATGTLLMHLKFCHIHMIMWIFILSVDHKILSHRLHSKFLCVILSNSYMKTCFYNGHKILCLVSRAFNYLPYTESHS